MPACHLQALLLFWAVLHSQVFLVLCWTATLPHLLRAAIDLPLTKALPGGSQLGGLAAALACTGVRCVCAPCLQCLCASRLRQLPLNAWL
jgi:hypothetical protein